jgi:hypothetical protein
METNTLVTNDNLINAVQSEHSKFLSLSRMYGLIHGECLLFLLQFCDVTIAAATKETKMVVVQAIIMSSSSVDSAIFDDRVRSHT